MTYAQHVAETLAADVELSAIVPAAAPDTALVLCEDVEGRAPTDWTSHPELFTADAAGNKAIRPFVLVSGSSETPSGLVDQHKRDFIRVGVYQDAGYLTIDLAKRRIKGLLDPDGEGERFGPIADGRYYIARFVDVPIRNGVDDTIPTVNPRGASMEVMRFRLEGSW